MGENEFQVVDLGLTTLLTSQVISVAFYSEREKSDKFWSEALISAWVSFTCRKSMGPTALLPFHRESYSEFLHSEKIVPTPAGFEPANLGSSGEYDNHGTTGVEYEFQIFLPDTVLKVKKRD